MEPGAFITQQLPASAGLALAAALVGWLWWRSVSGAGAKRPLEPDTEAVRAARLTRLGGATSEPAPLNAVPGTPTLPESSIDAAKAAIEQLVADGLTIFTAKVGDGTKDCKFCVEVLAKLAAEGIPFTHQPVGMKGSTSRTALIEMADGITSVPVGYCMGALVGGYDETDGKKGDGYGIMPLINAGKLRAALDKRDASALRTKTSGCSAQGSEKAGC